MSADLYYVVVFIIVSIRVIQVNQLFTGLYMVVYDVAVSLI